MSRLSKISNKINSLAPLNALAVSAGLSSLIYLFVFTLPFPLPTLYKTIPPVDYTKLTGYSPTGFWTYLLAIGLLFALYIWAIRLCGAGQAQLPAVQFSHIFGGSLAFALVLLFSYPLTAIDLFIYAIRTRGWAMYNLPPLSTPPEALPASDPWLGLAGEWVDAPSPYGPLWELFSLGSFYLSGGDFLGQLILLKLVAILAYLGCIWLVYQTLAQLQPDWRMAGTLAFAWNPLVLFESVQNGHNDIVMVFFLLAVFWLFIPMMQQPAQNSLKTIGATNLVCLLLAASILVKFVTVMVAPLLLLAIAWRQSSWTRRLTSITGYGLLTAMLVVAPMYLVWPGWENWAVLKANSGAGRSLLALLVLALRGLLGTNTAFDLSRNLILALFGLIYLRYLLKLVATLGQSNAHQRASISVITGAFYIMFWYVLLAAPVFHAWYLLWFLPLAPFLLPYQRPLAAATVFSITALVVIPYFETIRVWYPLLLRNHFLGHLIGVPLLIIPPAITLFRSIGLIPTSEV